MIKEVIKLDTQYWVLIEIIKQEKHEQSDSYVMRCCSVLEKANVNFDSKLGSGRYAEETEKQLNKERLSGKSFL
jgi:PREDICTED: similar to AGAP001581-PA